MKFKIQLRIQSILDIAKNKISNLESRYEKVIITLPGKIKRWEEKEDKIVRERVRKYNSFFSWISRMTKLREWQKTMAKKILDENIFRIGKRLIFRKLRNAK